MTKEKYNTKDIRHINKKNQEYIAENNRMTGDIKIHKKDSAACNFWKACDYYKQLKRLEQKNFELEESLKVFNKPDVKKVLTLYNCGEITRLEQENKSLYEEKNCLHKIIDRLLENAGYSKDIASAEDFEDVYEDMQIKQNELNDYRSVLEEIQKMVLGAWEQGKYLDGGLYNDLTNEFAKINEVLK